ncbi:MAG: hypothetical protein IKD43_02485 [Clostridia bacterium]|nr:hypothetical protein [Clostridia bacterium]
MQISTLISKPVLSPGGDAYGYVTDVRFARGYQKISCLVCADVEEEEFYVPLRAVLFFGDAVIVSRSRIATPTGLFSPIGKCAYTHTGEALGNVSDVILEEDAESTIVISDGKTQTVTRVSCASIRENAVLYPDAFSKAQAKGKAKNGTQAPALKTERKKQKENCVPKVAEGNINAPKEAKAAILNRTNLLGRHVRRSVYDGRGTPIAVAGECVTPAILSAARRAGRLLELTVNTLTDSPIIISK